jgi:hypothetical protein
MIFAIYSSSKTLSPNPSIYYWYSTPRQDLLTLMLSDVVKEKEMIFLSLR